MKYILTFLLATTTLALNAQVKVLSLNELNTRIAKSKDTLYVVNLWATWCAPCVAELPFFEQLHLENKQQPVKVILLSLDFKAKLHSDLIPFVIKHGLSAETYVIDEPNQQRFNQVMHKDWTGVLPATLFINTKTNTKSLYEKSFTFETLKQTLSTLR